MQLSIKTNKVLVPQVYVTTADLDNPVLALWFYCPQNFERTR